MSNDKLVFLIWRVTMRRSVCLSPPPSINQRTRVFDDIPKDGIALYAPEKCIIKAGPKTKTAHIIDDHCESQTFQIDALGAQNKT